MIYFTGDLHLGHKNIIKLCNRPFSSVYEMDETMIKNWNDRVKENDTVFILGDLFFRSENEEETLLRLKGKKRLIVGNHDSSWMKKVDMARFFLSADNYLETSDGRHVLTMCHYPMLTWNHVMRGFMIHGHIHNNTNADYWPFIASRDNILNAGVEVNDFMPVSFDELVENNRRFKQKFFVSKYTFTEKEEDEKTPDDNKKRNLKRREKNEEDTDAFQEKF